MIELRILHNIIAVTEMGTVAGAAAHLHMGQPALSRQIAQVERSLGFALFERTPRGMTLTPTGRPFIQGAKELIHLAKSFEDLGRRIKGGETTSLKISALTVTITDVLAPLIASGRCSSKVDLDLIPAIDTLPYHLLSTDTDLAISSSAPTADLEWKVIAEIPLSAQFPPEHHFADQDRVTTEELAGENLLLRQQGHQIRILLDLIFAREGAELKGFRECSVHRHAQALAARGQGVAVLTEAPSFNLIALPIYSNSGPVGVPIHAAWRADHFARDMILEVLDDISLFYEEYWNRQFRK